MCIKRPVEKGKGGGRCFFVRSLHANRGRAGLSSWPIRVRMRPFDRCPVRVAAALSARRVSSLLLLVTSLLDWFPRRRAAAAGAYRKTWVISVGYAQMHLQMRGSERLQAGKDTGVFNILTSG